MTVVASAAQPTPTRTLGSDSAELDAEDLWSAIVAVLRRVVAEVPDSKAIRSVAVASVGEAGVLLADDGRSLAPIIAWFDTRTRGELDWLLAHVGFERLHRLTGLCADPTFSLLKLLWLKRHRPDAFGAARHWLNLGDYLAWRLCGERATDLSLASRTMLLDLEHGGWSAPLLEMCGLPSTLLPPLRPSGTRLGRILPEVAAATGLPSDCVVGVGGHDHVCGMIAAGADAAGVLLDSLGTAEALTLIRDRPITDPALGRDGFNQGAFAVDAPLYYVFGGLPTAAACGRVVQEPLSGSRPRHPDRGSRGRRRRQRPVPAPSPAGLAALPRSGWTRSLSGNLLRHQPRRPCFGRCWKGSRWTAPTCWTAC